MKKSQLLLITIIISMNSYSQISFEKGYFIDTSNKKIECLIKNIDWKNNPVNFEYKLSGQETIKTKQINLVKEFSIYDVSKFIRVKVNIDRSGETISELSKVKNPIFKEEQLFLKVLVEGKANLYYYEDGNLKRYFYSVENSKIEQLVYKSYLTEFDDRGFNNHYKQQLINDLRCTAIKKSKIENLSYKKKNLVDFFYEFNKCSNSTSVNFEKNQKRDLFNLIITPRLNSSSLSIQSAGVTSGSFNFGSKTSFGIGLELEFIMPFNKNKWAFAIEPTYQSFKAEKTVDATNVSGGILVGDVDYSSVEIPITARHYMFLNEDSKLFINISYVTDISSESTIELKRIDTTTFNMLKIQTSSNLAFGFGYKLKNRLGLELRYQTSRSVLNYQNSSSAYRTLSLILGYSFL